MPFELVHYLLSHVLYTLTHARVHSLIIYNTTHANLSLQAVKCMTHLCFSSAVNQRDLLTSLHTSCPKLTREKIYQGFVEVLDLAGSDAGGDGGLTVCAGVVNV